MAGTGTKSVLFICLGNICRSPIAEAVFAHMVKERGLESKWRIDSGAMVDYHGGKRPDSRALATLKKYGVETNHRARPVNKKDFTSFDFIFGMDDENMSDLNQMKPKNTTAKLLMLGSYDPENVLIIEDPYYGGDEGFETVYQQCTRCCKAFLDEQSK